VSGATKTIAHVWPSYLPGQDADLHAELLQAGEFASVLLADQLIANGAAPYPATYYRTTAARGGWPGRLARVRSRLLPGLERRERLAFYEQHLRASRADLLHAHFGTCAAELVDLKTRLGLPLVATFYGVDASAVLQVPAWVARYRRLFATGDRFLVLCEAVKARFEALGCPSDKLVVWNMPLDFATYPYREHSPSRPLRLITAARFVEKKGYPVMLRAVARLKADGLSVRLTALGYGPLKGQIAREAAALGLAADVDLVDTALQPGFSAFYGDALARHDLFILASTRAAAGDDEGGPALSLVLAQAAGLPVVCTPFVGAERSVVDGETGMFCAPDDPDSLAERIAFLVAHPDRWAGLGRAASDLVRREFAKERQVAQVAAVYRTLLG
jgi:colanic acid/amylovoran biosynthesis glycosyltransferase